MAMRLSKWVLFAITEMQLKKAHKKVTREIGKPILSKLILYSSAPTFQAGRYNQRQETLDLRYLMLLCDILKNRMFLQNIFFLTLSWINFNGR
jgi:hypothetical protein